MSKEAPTNTVNLRTVALASLALFLLLAMASVHYTAYLPFIAKVPTPTRTPTPLAVDASTLEGKVIFGYQGWFSCPGDGAGFDTWIHTFDYYHPPVAANLTVDFWPDISELAPSERCRTDMTLTDGSRVFTFSSINQQTVNRHFQWMQQYGIDGIELQRFVVALEDPVSLRARNQVVENVRRGAETNGRVFYVMYDITGAEPRSAVSAVKSDWMYLVEQMRLTSSPQYLHHRGLPLVGLWGFGFEGRENTPEQAMELLDFFHSASTPERYRATVKGGIPYFWRSGTRDVDQHHDWSEVFRSFDVISPWSIGRYQDEYWSGQYRDQVLLPDIAEANAHGQDYMPVIFPGFSWRNQASVYHYGGSNPLNDIPRNGGKFYWRQAYNIISGDARMVFVAMFDEIDEGTAMFKLVPHPNQLPVGAMLVPLDIDGYDLTSDWYLQLGCETGRMLRKELRLSSTFPLPGPLSVLGHPSVEIQLGFADMPNGIDILPLAEGGLHRPLMVECTPGRQTVPAHSSVPASYLYFRVADTFYYDEPEPVEISVQYYDEGNEPILLEYDAAPMGSDWNPSTVYRSMTLAIRHNSRTWQMASIRIDDARFVGHQNGHADFRLATGRTPLTVAYIRIQKLR